MREKNVKVLVLSLCIVLMFSMVGCGGNDNVEKNIPEVTVNMGIAPYADHTSASIALEKGFYKDVGINLEWVVAEPDKVVGMLSAETIDVVTGGEGNFVPTLGKLDVNVFHMNGAFYGFAIVAQPDSDAKSVDEFVAEGYSQEEGMVKAMAQLKDEKFAYPSESGIKAFVDLCFSKGQMDISEVESLVQEDSSSVILMLNKDADFQTGGVPSRITLEGQGFKPILSAMDLIKSAEASEDSTELRSIVHSNLTSTTEYAEENHDTLLRLSSVSFRINKYIKDNPDDAALIHAGFLNKIAGTGFTPEEIKVSYNSLSPFFTFEEQASWYNNPEDPLYWSYIADSIITMYEEQGLLEEHKFEASDFIISDKIYEELLVLKAEAEANFKKLDEASGEVLKLKNEAMYQYEIYNYLDAARLSQTAIDAN